jgi:hypothetical protein
MSVGARWLLVFGFFACMAALVRDGFPEPLSGVVSAAIANQDGDSPSRSDPDLDQIASYRAWTKVTPDPVKLAAAMAAQCAVAGPRAGAVQSPHQRFFTVYVNRIGLSAMTQKATPAFPVGSMIVKEKLAREDGGAPELLTAMIKRPAGFNRAAGNWEYFVLNGSATEVLGRGKLENCQSCHSTRQKSDYVFRTYLAPEMRAQLR